jgi:hypothetical protein
MKDCGGGGFAGRMLNLASGLSIEGTIARYDHFSVISVYALKVLKFKEKHFSFF